MRSWALATRQLSSLIEVLPDNSVTTKIGEYFRVFRNKQCREMLGDRYTSLQPGIVSGTAPAELKERFYRDYCTKEKFIEYVQHHHARQDEALIRAAQELDDTHFC